MNNCTNEEMPNLGLAIVIFFNYYYYYLFASILTLVYLYKLFNLPYPSGNVVAEIVIFVLLCCIEWMRLFMARKGNLTDSWPPLTASLLLNVPSILGVLYCFLWQTYILRIEVIVVLIEIICETMVFVLGLLHVVTLFYYQG